MSVFKLINETKAKGKVKKIFNDIKKGQMPFLEKNRSALNNIKQYHKEMKR